MKTHAPKAVFRCNATEDWNRGLALVPQAPDYYDQPGALRAAIKYTVTSVSSQASPDANGRPLWHFDVAEDAAGKRRALHSAVFPDGTTIATFKTGIVTALEWAPDESSLAIIDLAAAPRTPLTGKPIDLSVRIIPLRRGANKTVATIRLRESGSELDSLQFRTLSWSR